MQPKTQRVADAKPTREKKPSAPFLPKNKEAVKHGLFARYLPEETRDIAEQMMGRKQIDILAEQIVLAYAAILRAQKIMYVTDRKDMTREIQADGSDSTGYLVQMAWDKQAAFLQAQARAQAQLANMIKLYDELSRSELATEEQRARIAQIKAATAKATGAGNEQQANDQIQAIADLINNPLPERTISDVLTMKEADADDSICTADDKTD